MTGSTWLDQLNAEGATADVVEKLGACCAAESWVSAVIEGRPYEDEQQLFAVSDRATANSMTKGSRRRSPRIRASANASPAPRRPGRGKSKPA